MDASALIGRAAWRWNDAQLGRRGGTRAHFRPPVLAAIMYGSWALIVHIPRIQHTPRDAFEWNGLFVASALCAGALLVAGSTARAAGTFRRPMGS